jgi:hypothetical protein
MNILDLLFKADTKELDSAEKSIDQLKDKVKDLTKEVPGLGDGFSKVGDIAKDMGKILSGVELGIAAVAVGAVALVGALGALGIAMAFKYNEKIDELGDLGDKYGYTASQMALMKQQVEENGGSLSAVIGVFNQVAAAAFKAKDPLKGTGYAFQELGINIKDASGQLKSTNDLVTETIEKWKTGEQTTADLAAAQKILGSNFLENIPAIESALDAQKRVNEYNEIGIGITEAATKAAGDNESINQDLSFIMTAMGSKIVADVIPAFTGLTKDFVESYKQGGLVAMAFDGIRIATDGVMTIFMGAVGVVQTLWSAFKLFGRALVDTVYTIDGLSTALGRLLRGDVSGASDVMKDLGKMWKDDMSNSFDDIVTTATTGWNRVTKVWEHDDKIAKPKAGNYTHGGGTTAPVKEVKDTSQNAIESLIAGMQKQLAVAQELNAVDTLALELTNGKYKEANQYNLALARGLALMKDGLTTEKMLNDGSQKLIETTHAYTKAVNDQINPVKKSASELAFENVQLKIKQDYLKTLLELQQKGLLTQESITAAQDNYNASMDEAGAAHDKLVTKEKDWMGNGVESYINGIGKMDDAMAGLVNKGLGEFESTLDTLFTSGKFNFADFARSIINDILKMIIQFTIMIPLAKALKESLSGTSGGGSFLGAIGSMFGFADGGEPQVGKTSIVGEKGAELFIPKMPGTIIPNSALGSSSNQVINNNLTVSIGSVDSSERKKELLQEIQRMMINTSKQTMANEMRQGGMLNRRIA